MKKKKSKKDITNFKGVPNIANLTNFAKKTDPKGVESFKYIFPFFMALILLVFAIFSDPTFYIFVLIFGIAAFYFYLKRKQIIR